RMPAQKYYDVEETSIPIIKDVIEFEHFLHVDENLIAVDYPTDQDILDDCFGQDESKDEHDNKDD
ncbi:hypothetical protein AVEN_188750-1, partial [Araneus ventricosus]